MRFSIEKKHVIDFLFPISLFFVFAATSLAVILLAANIYSDTTSAAESGYSTRTALSYITEKIHQSDSEGAVSLGTFDNRDALIIRQTFDHELTYTTYIYEDNGILRELFIQDGVHALAGNGKEIMPVQGFIMKKLSGSLFQFTCSSSEGKPLSTIVAVKSEKEGTYE